MMLNSLPNGAKRNVNGYFYDYDFSHEKDTIDHVIDHVYLGSCKSALEVINGRPDIGYILNLSQFKLYAPYKNVLEVDINDNPNAPIEEVFGRVHKFILDAKMNGTGILVHCRAGMSRSPTVIISYLMKYHGLTYDEAYKYVLGKRSVIRPNMGFVEKLKRYGSNSLI